VDRSESDKLKPPSVQGAFARKRREKAEREGGPTWVEPYAAPTPAAPQPEPVPAETVEPEVVAPAAAIQPDPEPVVEPVPEPEAEVTQVHQPAVSETAVLARVDEEPAAPATPRREPKQKAPKEPKAPREPKAKAPRAPKPARQPKPAKAPKAARTPKAPKAAGVPHRRRIPAFIPTLVAGACAGAVLVGLVAVFNKWGGQTDSINALELLGAFFAAIAVGFALLAVARIGHRAAISFLGVGLVAVVLMFFPSDRWQTLTGGIIVVIATAVAYVAAQTIAREATSDR
jgi:hypothetical protein